MPMRRLFRSEEGSAMIEFAMLAPVFFMLVMGLVEFVLYQYKSYALNHVVYEASRNLQTGEVQTAQSMSNAFHDEVCAQAGPMIDCNAIVFDVRSFDAVNQITFPPVTYDEQGRPVNFVFQPGGASKYSVVRASIDHRFVTPFMAQLFGMGPDKPAILSSYCIVKNEPWA
jgi:Flp pilus assembly protein TadG